MEIPDKPVANPVIVLREEFDDWAILFNPETAEAMGINPVGVAIWKLMDGDRNLKEIVADVKEQFADVPEAANEEISSFISNLVESGFVGYELEEFGQ
jgi:SynChlorMet cassette protein ScmD